LELVGIAVEVLAAPDAILFVVLLSQKEIIFNGSLKHSHHRFLPCPIAFVTYNISQS
jgi:hypothetical protein